MYMVVYIYIYIYMYALGSGVGSPADGIEEGGEDDHAVVALRDEQVDLVEYSIDR